MALTATLEPSRSVRLDYTVPATGATLTLARTGPSGTPASVRSWDQVAVTAGAIIARDFEAPIGVPITYIATTRNAAGTTIDTATAAITITASGCEDTWLNDLARTTNTMQVLLEALPELAYPVPADVHEIISRRGPIVTSDIAHTPAFELSFLTVTLADRDRARAALGNGIPVLLRTPPEDGVGNLYFSVTDFREQRIVTQGTVADRRFVVSGRQVERPDPGLYAPAGPAIYATIKAAFATYSALRAARPNYDAVLYNWAGSGPADIVPWPPVDV
jgi:hypothetical protein